MILENKLITPTFIRQLRMKNFNVLILKIKITTEIRIFHRLLTDMMTNSLYQIQVDVTLGLV